MPTYDYECNACGYTFEVFQNMSDEPLKKCPECGKRVRRLVGGGLGIIFKGSGFYVTDNKSSSNGGKAAKKDKSESSVDGGKTETKTDTKPESVKAAS